MAPFMPIDGGSKQGVVVAFLRALDDLRNAFLALSSSG